jgi:hypothetical protein
MEPSHTKHTGRRREERHILVVLVELHMQVVVEEAVAALQNHRSRMASFAAKVLEEHHSRCMDHFLVGVQQEPWPHTPAWELVEEPPC